MELIAYPRGENTIHSYQLWDTHPAYDLLEKDDRDGKMDGMEPKELWRTRIDYLDLHMHVFCGHVHQEKRKHIEEPGWVIKWNKMVQKMHKDRVNALEQNGDTHQQEHDTNKICERWEGPS